MKHFFLTLILGLGSLTAQSQELFFVELGSDPAICRVFDYQNGNGQVYCAASGIGDVNYTWTYLLTGETSNSSVWGGRNPGSYEIKVTDGINTIMDTILVDSLLPIANFEVISSDLDEIAWGYLGNSPVTVSFNNISENVFQSVPFPEPSDAIFFFKPIGALDWQLYNGDTESFDSYTFEYGGIHTSSLIAINKNSCRDTSHTTIGLFGPLSINNGEKMANISITTHSITNEITIQKGDMGVNLTLNLFSLTGKLIHTQLLTDPTTQFSFNFPHGIYLYEILDPTNQQSLTTGKFTF